MPAQVEMKAPTFFLEKSTRDALDQLRQKLKPFLVGKEATSDVILCGLLASGHILFEDIPGIGKTTLIKALAKLVGMEMSRIQCTSDLLPSDLLGVEVFSATKEQFIFHPGPLFSNFVLVDELNRTSPRTQSALLEAMAEDVVSINRKQYPLPQPFLVFATQNPSDHLGTYSLPESQLDRFAAKIRLWYPVDAQERSIFTASALDPIAALTSGGLGPQRMIQLQRASDEIFVSDRIVDFAKRVIDRTRNHEALKLGISTRGGVIWLRMARARALIYGRDYVIPDDLLALAGPCLSHRVVPRATGTDVALALETIIKSVDIE
jgi:MoxR-like ATPase